MKIDLMNVFTFLLDKYGEQFAVTYALKPSYLQSIVNGSKDEKIVFLNLEERTNTNSQAAVSPSWLVTRKPPADLDLTGSPLKDDCEIDEFNLSVDLRTCSENPWKPVEECHRGMDVDKARKIISNEAFQKLRSNETSGSVFLQCNGLDYEKTMLLQYEFVPGMDSRGIVRFIGFTKATALISAQPLLKWHFTSIRPGIPVETQIENIYQETSAIKVHCSWSTSSATPSLIDVSNCDVTLSQIFHLRDCGPITKDFVNQLRILSCIREEILSYKEDDESNSKQDPLYNFGCGIEMDELIEGINKIMSDVSGLSKNDIDTEMENDIADVLRKAQFRRLTDITDRLWDLLNRCSSYKELKAAFHVLFQCAARFNIVNMPTNKNRLAEIIAEVANRRIAIPCLTGTEPLELLLEIGLEKLYKDYDFIFTQSKICGLNNFKKTTTIDQSKSDNFDTLSGVRKSLRNAVVQQESTIARKTLLHNVQGSERKPLEESVGFKNSYFDENTTALQLARLIQIHCALEHLLMIQQHLQLHNVNTQICEQLLSRPLPCESTIMDESFTDKMEIAIPAYNVREWLEGKQPHSRRITFKSENKFRASQTTFYFNMENIYPPGLSECIENAEKEPTQEIVYYSWIYQKIQTLK